MKLFLAALLLIPFSLLAQKQPLDHSAYDGWQSIGERTISNDGKWVAFTVTPQEGDAQLYLKSADGKAYAKMIPRGYNVVLTEDSRYAVFRIKPFYKDTRDARIKKKKPEEFPKDSFAVIELGKDAVWKTAKVKSFKTPQKAGGWVAYHKEADPLKSTAAPTQKTVDSLRKTVDSLVLLVTELKNIKGGNRDAADADDDPSPSANNTSGSDLILRNLATGKEKVFKNVADYYFNPLGQKLMLRIAKTKDSLSRSGVVLYDLNKEKADTILKGGNDFKGFAFTEDGSRAAFVAERDTNAKALQRFYQLFVYNEGEDSAQVLVDKKTAGMQVGSTVSEWGNVQFSKSGRRLLFGTAAIQPPKDTSLVEIDAVKVDIWNYKDDYLQTQQLFQLQNELKRNYLAVFDFTQNKMHQIGSPSLPSVLPTAEGDGTYFVAITDTGRRIESQWSGQTRKDIYAVNVETGHVKLVKKNHEGQVYPSSTGNYILLYDSKAKNYFSWNGRSLKNISSTIKYPLYNEENDLPANPNPYGVMGWHQGDSSVYVYDRYDIWQLDPTGVKLPRALQIGSRKERTTARYVRLDPEERFIEHGQELFFKRTSQVTKKSELEVVRNNQILFRQPLAAVNYSFLQKAKNSPAFLFSRESFSQSPDVLVVTDFTKANASQSVQLSALNPQQEKYNWGTAELFKWKTFNGKSSEGILYKPENFDAAKKYPMIIYFYEKLSDGLYNYTAPAPTPSRLNIPFYVSRGYLVFAPDISYTVGGNGPGKDAYDYIVSGALALAKNKWVDARNMAIQGQSWGGYQVMDLITRTPVFKAAWAGAPVVNMTSAYGGIRWESGNNRQFQYEKGQSRIGASLWEKPNLYMENSPLFKLQKVTTPVVIMANDADGAVPWYQGIEAFTALRRLNKQVWMLNYNGEAHNLVERKNRKDIQIRQQQYFDWLLKGAKPAKWLTDGVPAVKKGKDWGFEIVD